MPYSSGRAVPSTGGRPPRRVFNLASADQIEVRSRYDNAAAAEAIGDDRVD